MCLDVGRGIGVSSTDQAGSLILLYFRGVGLATLVSPCYYNVCTVVVLGLDSTSLGFYHFETPRDTFCLSGNVSMATE
jgi:hypothetical protein